jgi:hypothetical protein
VLTIRNNNLTSEGENANGGGTIESGGTTKNEKNYWKLWSHKKQKSYRTFQ